jgi:hypothetical protein
MTLVTVTRPNAATVRAGGTDMKLVRSDAHEQYVRPCLLRSGK